jgi:hypothetical protein
MKMSSHRETEIIEQNAPGFRRTGLTGYGTRLAKAGLVYLDGPEQA